MKRLTKSEIAYMISRLPGNKPWSCFSLIQMNVDIYSRTQLVDIYNLLLIERDLLSEGYQTIL